MMLGNVWGTAALAYFLVPDERFQRGHAFDLPLDREDKSILFIGTG